MSGAMGRARPRGGARRGGARAGVGLYFVPPSPAEIDRLDVQHYAARGLLQGNYLAPVVRPDRVLDAGSGTGQWGHELAAEFPGALVAGVDLQPGKPGGPPNYRFVKGDLLRGLPFRDGRFDFVHQRVMVSSLPVRSWPAVVGDLARVTRPGGWVELVEPDAGIERAGECTARLFQLMMRIPRSRGLDSTGIVYHSLDGYLRRAGLADVERHELRLPLGEWGGQVGLLMATALRTLFTVLADQFAERFGVSTLESAELRRSMLREMEEQRSTLAVAVAFGRRPA